MQLDKERFYQCSRCPDDYVSGKYFFGTIGRFFARILIRTPFTPNQITWFWGGLMVISSLCYAVGEYWFSVTGGVLWIIAYSLDYTDGVVAKYKEKRSARGAYLDMIIHRVTYPLLMFCIGYGAFRAGDLGPFQFDWFKEIYFVFFGVAAGISMSVFMDITPLYEKYKVGDKTFQDGHGSLTVEGNLFKNKKTFETLMNFNPLVFTNMMILLLVFALIDQMGLFIVVFGTGYSLATISRILIVYRDL